MYSTILPTLDAITPSQAMEFLASRTLQPCLSAIIIPDRVVAGTWEGRAPTAAADWPDPPQPLALAARKKKNLAGVQQH